MSESSTESQRNPRRARTQGAGLFGFSSVDVSNGHEVVIVHAPGSTVRMAPKEARRLARILNWQANMSEQTTPGASVSGPTKGNNS